MTWDLWEGLCPFRAAVEDQAGYFKVGLDGAVG